MFLLPLFACQQSGNKQEQNTLTAVDSNAASNVVLNESEGIVLQTFSQIPIAVKACSGLFISDTATEFSNNYIIATNLKGTAFIKLNNRLLEMKLIRQTNIDSTTIYELYSNEEIEVDLKMKHMNRLEEENKYNGVLIIRRNGKS